MSALRKAQEHNTPEITAISANARIDYILRFSMHTVLVVDNNPDIYSPIGTQFIASLPEGHNAAYLCITPRLNNIQLRCRIIEQLFPSHLFDPELSLAVSVVNLYKKLDQPLSIAIDHCQHLSLQLLHELCQLSAIAKKAKLAISVVLTGDYNAARLANENNGIFSHNLSIVAANSGQLLSINSALFKKKAEFFTLTSAKKVILTVITLAIFAISAFAYLYHVSENKLANSPYIIDKTSEIKNETRSTTSLNLVQIPLKTIKNNLASSKEIYASLLNKPNSTNNADKIIINPPIIIEATPSDIFGAIEVNKESSPEDVTSAVNRAQLTFYGLQPDYYLAFNQGFVIQISGYFNQKTLDSFLLTHQQMHFYGYSRELNNREMLVVTSEVFEDENLARTHMTKLKDDLGLTGIFIKSISSVNNEISAFEGSQ